MKHPPRPPLLATMILLLTLVLGACAPVPLSSLFAPCPVPTAEEWEASQEQVHRAQPPQGEI